MDWRYQELASWIETSKEDPLFDDKTVFLLNPASLKVVDELIKRYFWPAMEKGVKGTGLEVSREAVNYIETVNAKYVTRSLTFVLEDPQRSLSNLSHGEIPPWYCRGNIKASLLNYMLSFDFLIYLPISFSIEKIIRLIGDDKFAGLPPKLTIGEYPRGNPSFDIAFSSGRGAGFGLQNYAEAASSTENRVRHNAKITKCVDELYKDLNNDEVFKELTKALLEEYEAF